MKINQTLARHDDRKKIRWSTGIAVENLSLKPDID